MECIKSKMTSRLSKSGVHRVRLFIEGHNQHDRAEVSTPNMKLQLGIPVPIG